MSNKVKYNLKNVHAAVLTETVTDGVTAFSYGTPKPIPGAVSIALDAEGESSPFYADGIVYFRSVTNNGYSGDLEIAKIPDSFKTDVLNYVTDSAGALVETTNAEYKPFALLFQIEGDKNARRHVLYNRSPLFWRSCSSPGRNRRYMRCRPESPAEALWPAFRALQYRILSRVFQSAH